MLNRGLKILCLQAACSALSLFAGQASAESVVVASYNLRNYLPMERIVDGREASLAPKPADEIDAAVRIIRSIRPDVLGLIEIGGEEMVKDLQGRLADAGLDLPHSEWVRGADPERHIALLSRLPIVARNSRDDVPFSLKGSRHRIGRGILDVTLRAGPSQTLRLVGAHLKSRRPVPDFDESEVRAKEAWLLRQHLDGILSANPRENLLLFGDLNATKNEYPIKLLAGSPGSDTRLRDLPLQDPHGARWTHFWPAADLYSRLDYFFASNHLWPLIDLTASGINNDPAWNRASDHRAISTTITFPKK